MSKLAVVAFGGNALLRAGQKGTIDEQEDNAEHGSGGVRTSEVHLALGASARRLELVSHGQTSPGTSPMLVCRYWQTRLSSSRRCSGLDR